jgi:purine-nucleoside phosphorylase
MLGTIGQTISYINQRIKNKPEIGIILGTGLSGLAREIEAETILDYNEIPNFVLSTVEGHQGRLIFGKLGGKNVMAMQGRFHFYEGYSMAEVTFPVRVMKFLGIEMLFVSNASGGLNPSFEIGDIMIINDHINLMPNPLIGKHYPEFGPRFPDMSEPYCKKQIASAITIAKNEGIKVQSGCYAGVTGPTLETPKEYEYFRTIGADAVGMSTVPEVIVARQMGMKCFAVSIITDLGVPGKIKEVKLSEIIAAAEKAEPSMTRLMKRMIEDANC